MKAKTIAKLSLSAIAFLTVLASCNTRKEEADFATDGDAILMVFELPGGETFKNKDMVDVNCASGTVSYMKSGDKWISAGDGYLRWGPRTSELSFYAVYPSASGVSYAQFFVPKNQSTEELLEEANYTRGCVISPKRGSDSKLAIPMERMMAKVRLKVAGLEGSDRVQAVKLGSLNGYTDTTSFNTKASDINPFCIIPENGVKGGNGCVFEAYVVPGPASSSVNLVSFSLGGVVYNKKGIPARKAGDTYEYTLTVKAGGGYEISGPTVI